MIPAYFVHFVTIVLPWILWIAMSIWIIYDAEKIPQEGWRTLRESKNVWVAISILLAWPFGLFLYLILVRFPLEKFVKKAREDEIIARYKADTEKKNHPSSMSNRKDDESRYAQGVPRAKDVSPKGSPARAYVNSNLRKTMESVNNDHKNPSTAAMPSLPETGPLASIPVVYPPIASPPEQPPVIHEKKDEEVAEHAENDSKVEELKADEDVKPSDDTATKAHPIVPPYKPTVHKNIKSTEDDKDSKK